MQMMLGKEHLQHFLSFPFASFSLSLSLSSLCVCCCCCHSSYNCGIAKGKGQPREGCTYYWRRGDDGHLPSRFWTGRLPVILLSACNKGLVSGGGNLGMCSRGTYIRSGTHWQSIEYWNFNELGLTFDQAGTKL